MPIRGPGRRINTPMSWTYEAQWNVDTDPTPRQYITTDAEEFGRFCHGLSARGIKFQNKSRGAGLQ